MKLEMERLSQQRSLEKLRAKMERDREEAAEAAAHDKWLTQQKRLVREARIRRQLLEELGPDVAGQFLAAAAGGGPLPSGVDTATAAAVAAAIAGGVDGSLVGRESQLSMLGRGTPDALKPPVLAGTRGRRRSVGGIGAVSDGPPAPPPGMPLPGMPSPPAPAPAPAPAPVPVASPPQSAFAPLSASTRGLDATARPSPRAAAGPPVTAAVVPETSPPPLRPASGTSVARTIARVASQRGPLGPEDNVFTLLPDSALDAPELAAYVPAEGLHLMFDFLTGLPPKATRIQVSGWSPTCERVAHSTCEHGHQPHTAPPPAQVAYCFYVGDTPFGSVQAVPPLPTDPDPAAPKPTAAASGAPPPILRR